MHLIKADFDNAVKQPWSQSTCILAQAWRRVNGFGYNQELSDTTLDRMSDAINALMCDPVLKRTMLTFDCLFGRPGHETSPQLVSLREELADSVPLKPVA